MRWAGQDRTGQDMTCIRTILQRLIWGEERGKEDQHVKGKRRQAAAAGGGGSEADAG